MGLTNEQTDKLEFIRKGIENKWHTKKLTTYFYTPHDIPHTKGVIDNLYKLIPDIEKNLTGDELFLLLCGAWFHDIGMIPGLFNNESDVFFDKNTYMNIRENHHKRSRDYIIKNNSDYNLNDYEAKIIGYLCLYHRRRENLNLLENSADIRVKLLAAYLRIADAIQIDKSRVDVYDDLYNKFLTEGMPLSSEFHWLRSYWITKIEVNNKESNIYVHFNFSEKEMNNDFNILVDFTISDLKEELDSCGDILTKTGVAYYTDIKPKFGLNSDAKTRTKLKQVISKLKIKNTASSSQLSDILMETIKYIAKYYNDRPDEAIEFIKRYCASEIGDLQKDRPCHILISHLKEIVDRAMDDDSLGNKMKLDVLTRKITAIQKDRKTGIEELSKHAKTFLVDYNPILLFGYSSVIIKALSDLDDSIKETTPIYVLECSSKNQRNYNNKLVYCDGLRYVFDLSEIGFKKVSLVPDIIVGNLISSKKIQKVIFGANTVDLNNKKIGHTAGHYTVICLAKKYDIPIFVFVDSYKFGTLNENPNDVRITDWFTGDKNLKEEIEKKKINYYNPRSDIIPLNDITLLITDVGPVWPNQFSEKLRQKIDRISKSML